MSQTRIILIKVSLHLPVVVVAVAWWIGVIHQPLIAVGLALVYELILFFLSGTDFSDTLLNRFTRFPRRYAEYLKYQHRVSNVRGLHTTGTYIGVDLNLAPSNPLQASTNPLEWKTLSGSQPIWGFIRRLEKQVLLYRAPTFALAILGPPGCGKTTLMKYIALVFAARKQQRYKMRKLTPILLFLREHVQTIVANSPTLAELAQNHFANPKRYPKLNPLSQWFLRQLRTGKCLVMLDGLDEAPLEHRQTITTWVDKQIREYPRCCFLLTARPQGYLSAPLTRAHVLEVIPFEPAQVERFIQNWYLANKNLSFGGKDDTGVRRDTEREARDLIERLQEKPQLHALTINPLLLTMIVNVYHFRGVLPERRVELYAEICDLLLEKWQQAKGVADTLTAFQKKEILQLLAAAMMNQKAREIDAQKALAVIEAPLIQMGCAKANISSFLQSLLENSGLFLENETGVWRFAHPTFQEYFCAVHWNKTGEAAGWDMQQWRVYIEDNWWHETLCLYAAQSDATLLVRACLQSQTVGVLKLAAQVTEESLKVEEAVRDDVANLLDSHQAIQLRRKPMDVSTYEDQNVFKLDGNTLRPLEYIQYDFEAHKPIDIYFSRIQYFLEYIQNDFEAHKQIIRDHATGLIWQQSGSNKELNYKEVHYYIEQLNRDRFAGHDDWRLPTIPELISLLEAGEQSNGLYINPIFDKKQHCCWSSDTARGSWRLRWIIYFAEGYVGTKDIDYHDIDEDYDPYPEYIPPPPPILLRACCESRAMTNNWVI